MQDPGVVIEAKDLRKEFGKPARRDARGRPKGVRAVDGIDLQVRRGEIFGLLGPNGAGKSTILAMLVTIHRPTAGLAKVAGLDVAVHPGRVRRRVGIVFQEPSLDTILTARENLHLHGRLYGVPRSRLRERAEQMLRLVGLESRADDQVKKFSGGMKRRLEVARGLMHEPEILFLDEPTLGLDPQTREHIWAYVRRLRDQTQTTIVLTTHYMDEADALCDRIAIIDHGKIVALGTPRELKASLGGDRIILQGPTASAKELGRLPFVRSVEVVQDKLHLTVEDAPRHLSALVEAAGPVASVEVRPARLEDVFIAKTGRAMRDGSEEEGQSEWEQYVAYQRGQ